LFCGKIQRYRGDRLQITFDSIADLIINKDKYKSLKFDRHHGLTRYIHSIKVARGTYFVAKLLHLDYVSATRGALLHDYFNDFEYEGRKGLQKPNIHPSLALRNAKLEYELNKKEENIIISHMFPFGKVKPNCPESWLVTTIDKFVAVEECIRFKLKEELVLKIIFIINVLVFKANYS